MSTASAGPGFSMEGPCRVPGRGQDIPEDELGAGALVTEQSVLEALRIARSGRVFDLDPGRFRGMPRHPLSPPFQILTYRTPRGIRNEGDIEHLQRDDAAQRSSWIDELLIGTTHIGAHIDALCHVVNGEHDEWHGGFTADADLGDFGALRSDASKIPPLISRGVLLDIPRALGLSELPPAHRIGAADVQRAVDDQGVRIDPGDAVLIRTGLMQRWPDRLPPKAEEPGLVLEGAAYLTESGPLALATDTASFEVRESDAGAHPQPVHAHVLSERGIYILEWLDLEGLAEAGVSEFLFVCLPLKIQGATGSWVRPVCIA